MNKIIKNIVMLDSKIIFIKMKYFLSADKIKLCLALSGSKEQ